MKFANCSETGHAHLINKVLCQLHNQNITSEPFSNAHPMKPLAYLKNLLGIIVRTNKMRAFAGLCVVQRSLGGTCRDLLGILRCWHGPGFGGAASGHLGFVPTLPDSQRLPSGRWWVHDLAVEQEPRPWCRRINLGYFHRQLKERPFPPTSSGTVRSAGCSIRWSHGVINCAVYPQRLREGEVGAERVSNFSVWFPVLITSKPRNTHELRRWKPLNT